LTDGGEYFILPADVVFVYPKGKEEWQATKHEEQT
jgi:hypothetical protein